MTDAELIQFNQKQETINKLLFILGVCSSYIINPGKSIEVKQWILESIDAVVYKYDSLPKFPA